MLMRVPSGETRAPSLIRSRHPARAWCFAQQRAILAGAVGDRRHVGLAEHLVGHAAAERLEQSEFVRAGLALRHQVRVLEHRHGAQIGAVHDGLVGPFEVEGVAQRLAQPRIGEFSAPRVDEPTLRAGRRVVGQGVAFDAAGLHGRKIVTGRPGARGELLAEQIALGGEALEADLAVAIIFVAHNVEIVLSAADRQIGAPKILDALIGDEAARFEAADAVRARAERHLERRLIERLCRIIGAGKNRQGGDEQRHVARPFRRERQGHRRVVVGFCGKPKKLLEIIIEEINRLERIVKDVLDFVRPFELTLGPINVKKVITEASLITNAGSAVKALFLNAK